MIRSFLMSLLAIVLTVAIYQTGIGSSLDSLFGDMLMRARGVRYTSAPVVYLRIDESTVTRMGPLPWDRATAQNTFSPLLAMGASRVVLAASDALVLKDPGDLRDMDKMLVPFSRSTAGVPRPMQITLPDPDGITRQLYSWNPLPRVEGYAWQYELLGRQPDRASIRVNFVGPPNSIGNLSLADVLKGAAPQDFIRDKIVVVGVDLPDLTRWVNVPVSDFSNPMTEAEFHAQALITLLEDLVIRSLPTWANVALLAGLVLLLWLLLLPTTIRGNLIVTALALLLALGGSTLVFLLAGILLPITGFVVLILMMFLASSERKARLIQERTLQIANTSSWELTLRPLASDRHGMSPDKLWQKLASFADLHLAPESMFLAQPDRTGGRIRITHQFAASESDIHEKRRDLSRAPYAPAIDRSAAHIVNGYMNDPNLTTILVPLFYPARLTGFWVVNIPKNRDAEQIRQSLELIGKQVARQLHFATVTPTRRERIAANGMDVIQRQLETIDRIFGNLIEEKIIYHSVLDSIGTGVALADVFGRILHMNVPLRQNLRRLNVRPEDMGSIAEVLDTLGAKAPGENGGWLLSLARHAQDAHLSAPGGTEVVVRVVSRSADAEARIPEGFLLLVRTPHDVLSQTMAYPNGSADI